MRCGQVCFPPMPICTFVQIVQTRFWRKKQLAGYAISEEGPCSSVLCSVHMAGRTDWYAERLTQSLVIDKWFASDSQVIHKFCGTCWTKPLVVRNGARRKRRNLVPRPADSRPLQRGRCTNSFWFLVGSCDISRLRSSQIAPYCSKKSAFVQFCP